MSTRRAFIGAGLSGAALLAMRRAPAQDDEPTSYTLAEASRLVRERAISAVDLARAYLERIERLDGELNAYITVTADLALEQARVLDAELAAGSWRGPLHGVPVALKDNVDTAGIATTAASELFADRVPAADAEIYRRLKAAGAVLLGKLNMHELAYGGTSAITHFGPVHNPWNLDHIPGGSSGGSAAAVAARLCAAALGTDTLASIRQPAAYCGVAGLKATHGLTSIRGIVPVAESLDHVGPMCRSVGDAALMLEAMAGFDARDPVSIRTRPAAYSQALYRPTGGLRLGIPGSPFYDALDPDVAAAVDAALAVLRRLTRETRDVTLPPTPDFSVLLAEAYAWHERYLEMPARRAQYDPVTLERLLAAGRVPVSDYVGARRELEIVRHTIADVFGEVDVLVTPTTPGLPERIADAENPAEASGAESSVRNTAPFNLYGIPSISVPCGFARSGLPVGLQISGPRLGELDVLALAHAYQRATGWHAERPPLG